MLALPFGFERYICRPDQAVARKVLLKNRLELELIFGRVLARDLADSRPAGLRVKRDAQPPLLGRAHLIFEFGREPLESEVAVDAIELARQAADVTAGEVRIAGNLEALGDAALDLNAIILRVVMPLALAAAVRRPERQLRFARLFDVRLVDIAEVRARLRRAAADEDGADAEERRSEASHQSCSP